eukprot:comp24188_c0_seq1/m.44329 comp24188_c0_seq1/g.44329  ORF comp24188_c0_seq1/g.44329 comp24188_c0_seq1/m.44329 type:complete len:378 (-) comp24188_c0_seq1:177-1310(-)
MASPLTVQACQLAHVSTPAACPALRAFVQGAELLLAFGVAEDFSLAQAVCSYGYFGLAPNTWTPAKDTDDDHGWLLRLLRYGRQQEHVLVAAVFQDRLLQDAAPSPAKRARRARACIEQPASGRSKLVCVALAYPATCTRRHRPSRQQQHELVAGVRRMVRADMDLRPWHALHPDARQRGFGRTYRSPTLFEDLVKTITNCNMRFSGTVRMNSLLCAELGRHGAFPSPWELAAVEPADLQARCKVGYRAGRIVALARAVVAGTLDLAWYEHTARTADEVFVALQGLEGFGPFAAKNVLQLLGFFEHIPADSETVRHFKEEHGAGVKKVGEVVGLAAERYAQYAPYQFLAYWFDLWRAYERQKGRPSPYWQPAQVVDF